MSDVQGGSGGTIPPEASADQDLAYQEALEGAWVAQSGEGTPLAKARRRRITSRAVMISLSVIAVCLSVGGVLAPQISYAREASRFSDIAAEANAAAGEAESLAALHEAEDLLFALRSHEARGIAPQLKKLSKSTGKVLSPAFKADMATAASELESALDPKAKSKVASSSAKKAEEARDLERPNPHTWFDVQATQLLVFADITPDEIERADVDGTVTLDRVREVSALRTENKELAHEVEENLGEVSARNADLSNVITSIVANIDSEAERAMKAATVRLDASAELPVAEPGVELGLGLGDGEEKWRSAESALRDAIDALDTAVSATTFAEDSDGAIIGVTDGAVFPEGAVRIPGGDMIRLAFVLPEFQAFVSAGKAEREAAEALDVARAAAEAEAAAAAAAAEAIAGETYTPLPDANSGASGQGGGYVESPTPSDPPPVEPTPDPTLDPTPDPPTGPGDADGADAGADGLGS